MKWNTGQADDTTIRAASRYEFAVPMAVELSNGWFMPGDHVDGLLVELSEGGAAVVAPSDDRYKVKKRYRVHIDDHAGIIEIRNITPLGDSQTRLGILFIRLGLELQELVVDSLDNAKLETSRLAA